MSQKSELPVSLRACFWRLLCLLFLMQCCGCVTASIATIGAALDVASSAVTTGSDVYQLGKLMGQGMGSFVVSFDAVLRAAPDLNLHLVRVYKSGRRGDVGKFRLEDDLEHVTDVVIERRSGRMCLCEVNVGFFGSEPTAGLIMDRIRHHLAVAAEATTRPEPVLSTGERKHGL